MLSIGSWLIVSTNVPFIETALDSRSDLTRFIFAQDSGGCLGYKQAGGLSVILVRCGTAIRYELLVGRRNVRHCKLFCAIRDVSIEHFIISCMSF